LLVFSRYCLAPMTLRTYRSSTSRTLSHNKQENKASDPWPYWSYVLSLSSSCIGLHALILLPKPHTFRIWVYTWLVMLSHAVMSVVHVFHPLWCWGWLVALWECCCLPSVEMRVERGEDRYCGLSNGWNGGDGWYHHGMWCSNLLRIES
jgi:hypothetical protein